MLCAASPLVKLFVAAVAAMDSKTGVDLAHQLVTSGSEARGAWPRKCAEVRCGGVLKVLRMPRARLRSLPALSTANVMWKDALVGEHVILVTSRGGILAQACSSRPPPLRFRT